MRISDLKKHFGKKCIKKGTAKQFSKENPEFP
jgi:hypothetical protein